MGLITATDASAYKQLLQSAPSTTLFALLFWADWHQPSVSQLDVFNTAAKDYPNVQFVTIDVDNASDVVELYEQQVTSVPTYILVREKKILQVIDGVNPVALISAINTHQNAPAATATISAATHTVNSSSKPSAAGKPIATRLQELTHSAPVMLFIKGTPDEPRCGFSRTLVNLMNDQHIEYSTFDILGDQVVREELKKYTNWPTYPQVYIEGKLIGGLDVIKEMISEDEFVSAIPQSAYKSAVKA